MDHDTHDGEPAVQNSFHLTMLVKNWIQKGARIYDKKAASFFTERRLTLVCWKDRKNSDLIINGKPWLKDIEIGVRSGTSVDFDVPIGDEHCLYKSSIGEFMYLEPHGEEHLLASIRVPAEMFAELIVCRHDLRRIVLRLVGDKIDNEYTPSWSPGVDGGRALHVVEFDFTCCEENDGAMEAE